MGNGIDYLLLYLFILRIWDLGPLGKPSIHKISEAGIIYSIEKLLKKHSKDVKQALRFLDLTDYDVIDTFARQILFHISLPVFAHSFSQGAVIVEQQEFIL